MKLVRFEDDASGLVVGPDDAEAIDIGDSLSGFSEVNPDAAQVLRRFFADGGRSWVPLIDAWDEAREALRALSEACAVDGVPGVDRRSLSGRALNPPVPAVTSRTVAMGGNFVSHVRAASRIMEIPEAVLELMTTKGDNPPWGFHVVPGTVVGQGGIVRRPDGVEMLDYEAEFAVVLLAGGANLTTDDVRFWGYTAWNDFSIRDQVFGRGKKLDYSAMNWAMQKNFTGSNSCGPWLVVDEPQPAGGVRLRCRVNGELRQDESSENMIYTPEETFAYLSTHYVVNPGDMVASGTPAGTAVESGPDGPFLQTDDVVEVEVQGVGTLTNVIGPPLAPAA